MWSPATRRPAADGRPVTFRTLDIGSDKVLPYMKPQDEPNPAMGWRALRVALGGQGVTLNAWRNERRRYWHGR